MAESNDSEASISPKSTREVRLLSFVLDMIHTLGLLCSCRQKYLEGVHCFRSAVIVLLISCLSVLRSLCSVYHPRVKRAISILYFHQGSYFRTRERFLVSSGDFCRLKPRFFLLPHSFARLAGALELPARRDDPRELF